MRIEVKLNGREKEAVTNVLRKAGLISEIGGHAEINAKMNEVCDYMNKTTSHTASEAFTRIDGKFNQLTVETIVSENSFVRIIESVSKLLAPMFSLVDAYNKFIKAYIEEELADEKAYVPEYSEFWKDEEHKAAYIGDDFDSELLEQTLCWGKIETLYFNNRADYIIENLKLYPNIKVYYEFKNAEEAMEHFFKSTEE